MESFFYKNRDSFTRESAKRVMGLLYSEKVYRSVVDLGCGVGTFLSVSKELGATTIQGYEESDDAVPYLQIDDKLFNGNGLFEAKNDEIYELALCLEVAEHIDSSRAEELVHKLTSLSSSVLFSAAIPHQNGYGHINCRPQSYWAGLFAQKGYTSSTRFREKLWYDENIHYWYRQNILVYEKSDSNVNIDKFHSAEGDVLDVVHPTMVNSLVAELSNKHSASLIKRLLKKGRWVYRRLRSAFRPVNKDL